MVTVILSRVAPHAGAWIETQKVKLLVVVQESRLMQARGLKQDKSGDNLIVKRRASCRRVD